MTDVLDLTKFDEHVYNTFLRITRSQNDQPYRLRKQFDDLPDKTKISVKKITSFLTRFTHIKVEEFFLAPYKIYPDEKYFDLEYYTSLKATKAYTLYQKKKIYSDPDSDEQIAFINESLQFILRFCREQGISLADYINHKIDTTPSFLVHLKEHNVNIYTLLGLNGFNKAMNAFGVDMVKFIISEELYNQVDVFRTKLFASKKAAILVEKGLQKIHTLTLKNS